MYGGVREHGSHDDDDACRQPVGSLLHDLQLTRATSLRDGGYHATPTHDHPTWEEVAGVGGIRYGAWEDTMVAIRYQPRALLEVICIWVRMANHTPTHAPYTLRASTLTMLTISPPPTIVHPPRPRAACRACRRRCPAAGGAPPARGARGTHGAAAPLAAVGPRCLCSSSHQPGDYIYTSCNVVVVGVTTTTATTTTHGEHARRR